MGSIKEVGSSISVGCRGITTVDITIIVGTSTIVVCSNITVCSSNSMGIIIVALQCVVTWHCSG